MENNKKSRELWLFQHSVEITKSKEVYLSNKEKEKSGKGIEPTFDAENYNYLGINFTKDFEKINIKDLILDKVNQNKYLILKIVSQIYIVSALKSVVFIGEDENKELINVCIRGYEKYFNISDWDELEKKIYSQSKYIIILEPFYNILNSNECVPVRYPSETILLNDEYDLKEFLEKCKINTKENYKELGNLMMKVSSYEKAIYYYELSIKETKNELEENKIFLPTLESNLSEAYWKYGYKSKSLFYAEEAIKHFSSVIESESKIEQKSEEKIKKAHELLIKSLFRKLRSLVGLRKYKEAYAFLFESIEHKNEIKELLSSNSIKHQIDPILSKINKYKDNENGKYDFSEMMENENIDFYLENGNYLNPKISIDFDPKKGVRLIANKKIQKSELLIAEKAVGCFPYKNKFQNPNSDVENDKHGIENFNKIFHKVVKCPYDYEEFFSLYDGKNLNELAQNRKKFLESSDKENIEKIKEKVIGTIKYNQFAIKRHFYHELNISSGVWYSASLVNHSCLPNCFYFGIGDFYISFSTTDIDENEEITVMYQSFICNTFKERAKALKETWGIECDCQLCKFEKSKIYNKNNTIKAIKEQYENLIQRFSFNYKGENKSNYFNNFNNDIVELDDFLNKHKKSLTCFESAKANYLLEMIFKFCHNYDLMKKYFEQTIRYSKDRNFWIYSAAHNIFALLLEETNNNSELEKLIENIIKILEEYTPLNESELRKMIMADTDYYKKKIEELPSKK